MMQVFLWLLSLARGKSWMEGEREEAMVVSESSEFESGFGVWEL